jgi:hypothetical protein
MHHEIVELILDYLSFISQKTETSPSLDVYNICKMLEAEGYITEHECFRLED